MVNKKDGSATQSSTLWLGEASRAIDGGYSLDSADKSCTRTNGDGKRNWWQYTLLYDVTFESVDLYSRECQGNCSTRLHHYDINVLTSTGKQLCANTGDFDGGKIMKRFHCQSAIRGHGIIVEKPNNTLPLIICEVDFYVWVENTFN